MYKDKDRQREATRERVRRYRALHKGVTVVDGPEGRYMGGVTPSTERDDGFVSGMASWVLLRGVGEKEEKAETGSQTGRGAPPVVATASPRIPSKSVPDWRAAKDRQMQEFLKRHSK